MKSKFTALLFLLTTLSLLSCNQKKESFVIGVSQCSEDSWRQKLKEELELATYFNEGVSLRFASANDDSRLQERQIDSLVCSGIDLLIVSPNQVDLLSDEIDRAYDAGIPVILFDRKTNSSKYTAFVGADNFQIGQMMGHYLAGKLGGNGNVLEIGGLTGSSPAAERHEGFAKAIGGYPGIRLAGFANGDWTEQGGNDAMRRILKEFDGKVDAVFGGNDRMAVGARKALREAGRDKGEVIYAGVDALPSADGGIRMVADSILIASAMYPTRGDELMLLALDILRGRPFKKETMMRSSIVTQENAEILLLQHEEIVRQAGYLDTMHKQAGSMHDVIKLQQVIMGIILLSLLVIAFLMSFYILAYRQKRDLSRKLQEEMEKVESQRDELEEQRDRLIELSLAGQEDEGSEDDPQNRQGKEFLQKFSQAVERNIDNPDLSVEDISTEMCMSRVQLYRKVKAACGKSPVEIIRQMRLVKADRMLSETSLNISEIAYKVGFSSASYFTKCYRDFFDRLPTKAQKM